MNGAQNLMNTKTCILLISVFLCFYKTGFTQSLQQSVQTALENNEGLRTVSPGFLLFVKIYFGLDSRSRHR